MTMKNAVCGLLCLAAAQGVFAQESKAANHSADIEALVADMPTSTPKLTHAATAKVIKLGEPALEELCSMILPPGQGDDSKARFMVNALAFYVNRSGAKSERQLFTSALSEALEAAKDSNVRVFFIEQLQIGGGPDAVKVISKFLTDENISDSAARALVTIGTSAAGEALLEALPSVPEAKKEQIVLALGDLKVQKAADPITEYAKSASGTAKYSALQALASIGVASANELMKSAGAKSPYDQGRINALRVQLARRLAEKGSKSDAVKICEELISEAEDAGDAHVHTSALRGLVDIKGKSALADLTKALDVPSKEVRMAALNEAIKLPGKDVTRALEKKADSVNAETKAEIISQLGRRGDKSATSYVTDSLKSEEPEVNIAGLWAAFKLQGNAASQSAIKVLKDATDDSVIAAAKQVLLTTADDKVLGQIAGALKDTPGKGRIALIEILGERVATKQKQAVLDQTKDEDSKIRVAALKTLDSLASEADVKRLLEIVQSAESKAERSGAQNAVVAVAKRSESADKLVDEVATAFTSATGDAKIALLETLGKMGGEKALKILIQESKSDNTDLKMAAIRALGEWPDISAAEELAAIARTAKEENQKVIALRGYVRLAGLDKVPDGKRLKMLREALEIAPRTEEKQLVIGALADIRTSDSLELLYPLLTNKDLKNDAAVSVYRMVERGRGLKISDGRVLAALQLAYPLLTDEEQKRKALDRLDAVMLELGRQEVQKDGEGFATLFNGKDLNGWVGATGGYVVENGNIVCLPDKGGNLFTERDYSDFVFRFEFKLEPGANNGLGIRAPLTGDAAFDGMELQILDDTSDKYKDLKDWQRHGSVYGILPAKPGHLKPVGEWNTQEVTANGKHIKVVLNGETIVDGNIEEASKNGTADGRPHPGLKRVAGRIGFLGHGSRVEFRNIRIKEILNQAPEGFTALFNGKDLDGWKGLVENPIKRAQMKPEELAKAQEKADQNMRDHWQVVNETLVFDGKGESLCTAKDYGDFEMLVDWKMGPLGDSGIYLRGSPQVQIWDPAQWPVGSGGLYNNKENTSVPLEKADNPIGDWNRFRIKMVGEKVTVHLNDVLVVDNVVLENYWDRNQSIFPTGQLELQNHGSPLFFRNVFVREISADEAKAADSKSNTAVTETNEEPKTDASASTETATESETKTEEAQSTDTESDDDKTTE